MTRPDDCWSRFEEMVVVYEGIFGSAMRRDLLAAHTVRWKLHNRPHMRNHIDAFLKL